MAAFGRRQAQCLGQGVQDAGGGARAARLLKPYVVVDGDMGQLRHLLAAQARGPARGVGGEAEVVRAQGGAALPQEAGQFLSCHGSLLPPTARLPVHPSARCLTAWYR